jgi:hypothetical protein
MLNDGFPDDARQEDNRFSTPVLIVMIWGQRECRLRWRAVVWTKNLPNDGGVLADTQIAEVPTVPVRIDNLSDAEALEAQLIELSIVGKNFLCLYAPRHIVYI